MTKVREKLEARLLRSKGSSIAEIASALGISKSSASLWVRDVALSNKAVSELQRRSKVGREKSLVTRRAAVDAKIVAARSYARDVVSGVVLNPDTSRLLCALIYWCEGAKIRRGNTLSFTNSDPGLVTLFMKLLREGFDIKEDRLRLNLHIHDYHDKELQLQFWSKIATIPIGQCHKPYQKPHTGIQTRDGYQGCVSIRYLDVDFGRRLESIATVYLEQGP